MKNSKFKKILSIILALIVVFGTSFAREKIHPSKKFYTPKKLI